MCCAQDSIYVAMEVYCTCVCVCMCGVQAIYIRIEGCAKVCSVRNKNPKSLQWYKPSLCVCACCMCVCCMCISAYTYIL